jgi:hypothetical protein
MPPLSGWRLVSHSLEGIRQHSSLQCAGLARLADKHNVATRDRGRSYMIVLDAQDVRRKRHDRARGYFHLGDVLRSIEDAGLITSGLRQVTILNRKALVAASCECYGLVRKRVALHLPKTSRKVILLRNGNVHY